MERIFDNLILPESPYKSLQILPYRGGDLQIKNLVL